MAAKLIGLARSGHLSILDCRTPEPRIIQAAESATALLLADALVFPVFLDLPRVDAGKRAAIAQAEVRASLPVDPRQHSLHFHHSPSADVAWLIQQPSLRAQERRARQDQHLRPVAALVPVVAWMQHQMRTMPKDSSATYRSPWLSAEIHRNTEGHIRLGHWTLLDPEPSAEAPEWTQIAEWFQHPVLDFSSAFEKRPGILARLPRGNQLLMASLACILLLAGSFGAAAYSTWLAHERTQDELISTWQSSFPDEELPFDPVGILLSRIQRVSGGPQIGIAPQSALASLSRATRDMRQLVIEEFAVETDKQRISGSSPDLQEVDVLLATLREQNPQWSWKLVRSESREGKVEFQILGGPA